MTVQGDLREAVLYDVMDRIAGELGEEIFALDWGVLNVIGEAEDIFGGKQQSSIDNAKARYTKLKQVLDGKADGTSPEHRRLIFGAIKKRMRGEQRLIKRAKKSRSKAKKCGHETVAKPEHLQRKLDGVALRRDKNGYFVSTHRARCKSYETPDKIPIKKIQFIRSTG